MINQWLPGDGGWSGKGRGEDIIKGPKLFESDGYIHSLDYSDSFMDI